VRRGFVGLLWLLVVFPLAPASCATGSVVTQEDDGGRTIDGAVEGSDSPVCNPETGGGDGGGTSDTKACGDWVNNYCAELEMCANFVLITTYGDKLTCSTQLQRQCLDVLGAPGSGFTGDGLEACLTAVKAENCFDFLHSKPNPNPCRAAGTVDNGKACRYDFQCRSAYCKLSGNCGNCVTPGLTGSPCSANNDCDGNLMCAGIATCQPPQDTGAMCDMMHPCKEGLVCVSGSCAAPAASGASCAGGAVCDGQQGVYCDAMSMTCTPYTIPMNGQPCSATAICFGGAACNAGSCVAASTDGSSCDTMSGIGCVSPDSCTAGTCTIFTASQCM
jgi:hypothetical protein